MTEPQITPELIARHGLTDEEYAKVLEILGRTPTWTELGIFSVMWSEHCSYKSSRIHLKKLPTSAPWVIQGPGENAGVIDIGDGLAAVFKIESHNHPSFIEPYQGAATGVGGILRDVFTMGARPIASLNSLRFGSLDNPKNRFLLSGVTAGIAGYGNCMGVPTVGGEIYFNDIYSGNPLVNAFTLGIARTDKIFKGTATGVGNPVIYVGSRTGRDGIHGATMASAEFDDKSEEKRPTVQVGDPFTEKLLLEACLELMAKDTIVGIQDMGAAGLTSSSCEMAGRAGNGIELELSYVPQREENMTAYEMMLSESQERMLMVVKEGREQEAIDIFKKWDLEAAVIGRVTSDGMLRVKHNGEVKAEIPAKSISDEAPLYDRPLERPEWQVYVQSLDYEFVHEPTDYSEVLRKLLASPTIASKEWVYRQYDHMVRTNSVVLPGSDAAVVRIKGTNKALAMSVDCNSRYCFLDPYLGGAITVAEASRNVVCSGARPLALTDCLNFGNPEKPEVMWQFSECLEGMAEACRRLNVPVISGNVSLYNDTKGISIYPTPTVAVVGLMEDVTKHLTQWFKEEGDIIALLGVNADDIDASEYLSVIHHMEKGVPPNIDIDLEKALYETVLEAADQRLLRSAHDCADGGLAVALAECCISNKEHMVGASVEVSGNMRLDGLLFGETQSRIIVSLKEGDMAGLQQIADTHKVSLTVLGKVGGDRLKIKAATSKSGAKPACAVELPLTEMNALWRESIGRLMSGGANA